MSIRGLLVTIATYPVALVLIALIHVRLSLGDTVMFGTEWYYTISSLCNFIANHKVELIGVLAGAFFGLMGSLRKDERNLELFAGMLMVVTVLFSSSWFRSDIPLLNLLVLFGEKKLELSFVLGMISLGSVFCWTQRLFIAPAISTLIIISIMTLYL